HLHILPQSLHRLISLCSPYTTLFRSLTQQLLGEKVQLAPRLFRRRAERRHLVEMAADARQLLRNVAALGIDRHFARNRVLMRGQDRKSTRLNSKSRENLVCRLLLEKI